VIDVSVTFISTPVGASGIPRGPIARGTAGGGTSAGGASGSAAHAAVHPMLRSNNKDMRHRDRRVKVCMIGYLTGVRPESESRRRAVERRSDGTRGRFKSVTQSVALASDELLSLKLKNRDPHCCGPRSSLPSSFRNESGNIACACVAR
jgi:hypothetical protein